MLKSNQTAFFTQKTVLLVAILMALVISSYGQFSDGGKAIKAKYPSSSTTKRKPVNRSKIRLNDPEEKPHYLVGSYYTTKNGFTSNLLINNKGPQPIEVQPTLYSLAGQILQVPPITVPPNSHQTLDLASWATIGGNEFKEGSVHLFHRGEDIVLGTQIQIVKESKSLIFEKKLEEIGAFDSRRLESVWWHPSNEVKSKVVLTNTGDNYLTVSAMLTRKPAISNTPQDFTLLPHETKVLNIETDFNQGDQFISKKVLGVSLTHDGEEGDLLAWGIIKDAPLGYSYSADFTNPNSLRSKKLHGAGLQLGKIGTDKLKPIVVLRNNSTEEIEVDIKVPYTKENGNKKKEVLDSITLAPGEIHNVDMDAVKDLQNVRVAGIKLVHTGTKGSLTASVQSVSQSKTHVFRTILWNPKSTRSSASIYPWSISGTSHTKAYIKNSGFKSEKYLAYLTWANDGEYTLSSNSLEKDETIEFDVRALRDNQVPDENGRTIPQNVDSGQIHWYLRRTETSKEESAQNKSPLIGQMVQVDTEKGMNFSYFCINCCDYGPSYISVVALEPDLEAGETMQFQAFNNESDCYGNYPKDPPNVTSSANWSTSNSSIAVVNNDSNKGLVTGVYGGAVSIKAEAPTADHFINPACEGGGGGPLLFESSNQAFKFLSASFINSPKTTSPFLPGDCDCICFNNPAGFGAEPLLVKPKVSISVPSSAVDGSTVMFEATVTGGTASSYQWSFTTPSGAGNNPHMTFTAPTNYRTEANAHWFAASNAACPTIPPPLSATHPYYNSEYKVKMTVTFADGSTKSKEKTMKVNNWWSPAGSVGPPTIAGGPSVGPDAQGVWRVLGVGSMVRTPQTTPQFYLPSTSQFYNKTVAHENVHITQFQPGGISQNYVVVAAFYQNIQGLTASSQALLSASIATTYNNYILAEVDRIRLPPNATNQLTAMELAAFQVSDQTAPLYAYQLCGRTVFTSP